MRSRPRRIMGRSSLILALVSLIAAGALFPLLVRPTTLDETGLTTREGVFTKAQDGYAIDGMTAHVGPGRYIRATTAASDYDGDGTRETIVAELDGLVGTTVRLQGIERVSISDDRLPKRLRSWAEQIFGDFYGDRTFDVYAINGHPYRNPNEERPPWAGGNGRPSATPAASPQAAIESR